MVNALVEPPERSVRSPLGHPASRHLEDLCPRQAAAVVDTLEEPALANPTTTHDQTKKDADEAFFTAIITLDMFDLISSLSMYKMIQCTVFIISMCIIKK